MNKAINHYKSLGLDYTNIFYQPEIEAPIGEVYVVDWGIAIRAAKPGDGAGGEHGPVVGTPSYMSPEMVLGDVGRMDARTDVYLLGATLHNVLTGRARHLGMTLYDVLLSARESAPFAYEPDVPAELAAICNKAMRRDPADRYATALALRQAVGYHAGDLRLVAAVTRPLSSATR